jgi:hypothetical protein
VTDHTETPRKLVMTADDVRARLAELAQQGK